MEGRNSVYCIPPATLITLEQVKMPRNRRELQHALSLLVSWRKHIPDFSIIAQPLYHLTKKKRTSWDWTPVHREALVLLIFEARVYQAVGLIYPTDPLQIEALPPMGFQFMYGSGGPKAPLAPLNSTPEVSKIPRSATLPGKKAFL